MQYFLHHGKRSRRTVPSPHTVGGRVQVRPVGGGIVPLSVAEFFGYKQLSDRSISDRSNDSSRSNCAVVFGSS